MREVVTSSQGGRRVAEHPVRPRGRQLQRVLARHGDHGADGRRLLHEPQGLGAPLPGATVAADARAGRLRVRPGRVRLPRHGPGDDRRRLLRPGDRQRAVGLRALDDRADSRHQGRAEEDLRLRRRLRARQAQPRGERRRRQHLQGDRQAGAHRHGRRRRDDDDLLDHRGADRRPRSRSSSRTCRSCTRRSCSG